LEPDSSRPQARSPFRKAVFAAVTLLLVLTAGGARHSFFPKPAPDPAGGSVVHGRWLEAGLPPARGEEEEEGEGSDRERLLRWLESRHRAAPGFDWRAIEAENLRASLDFIRKEKTSGKARAAKPVWRERGPLNQTGATALVAFRPDGKTILVGTSQGGVFSGTPGSWKRLTDTLGGYLHGLLVSEKPEIWAAAVSGLNDGRVYVSRNRGAAWSPAKGLPPLVFIDEMIQDGGNHRVIYMLGRIGVENGSVRPIIARSRDGGLSFAEVWRGESSERPGLWTSRIAAGPLYLVSQGQLFLSNDQGSSFSPLGQVTSPFDKYVILRGSEAGAPTLYAATGRTTPETLHVSEDGGGTWESRFQLTGTSYYGLDARFAGGIAASIRDPNLVLFGNADTFRSTDSGRTFERVSQWYDYYDSPSDRLHADINGIQFVIDHGQEKVFLSTDGGTYLSTNGGLDVRNITETGLPSGQFYSTWSSASNPDLFLVGSQDQGLQLSIPVIGRTGAALSNTQLISGDYSGLASATHDMTNVFAIYPTSTAASGQLMLFRPRGPNGVEGELVATDIPPLTQTGFFASSAADPDDPATVYVAGDHIWKMQYLGNGRFSQSRLPQNFSPNNSDYVSALAIAPSDHSLWYATTAEGRLWYSRDHGNTWSESDTTQAEAPTGSNGALAVSAVDPFTCFAGGSGYGNPSIWVTHDGGVNWSPMANGLPSTTVWGLGFEGSATPALYAATETGPFVLDAGSSTWRSLLGGGAPSGRYFSVEGVPSAKLVRFGTYSRGVWDYVPPPRR
jgi:hypothetical protein